MAKKKKPKAPEVFESEGALCSQFMEYVATQGFAVYPETNEFDILLVATASAALPFKVGDQIGVQAKLKGNFEVIMQCFPHQQPQPKRHAGTPNYYAVLVPVAMRPFKEVCERLGIAVLEGQRNGWVRDSYADEWVLRDDFNFPFAKFKEHPTNKFSWVPDVEVGLPAGVAGPRKLTTWKLNAIKLALRSAIQGGVTTKDFKDAKIDMGRWYKFKWIVPLGYSVVDGKRCKIYEVVWDCENMRVKPPHATNPEIVDALIKAGVVG